MVRPQGQDQPQQRRRLTMGPNKQWTDKFKSKSSSGSNAAAFPSVLADGSEERTLEPKRRWKPRPEQIRLLETIFDSGMVKPPSEEISKIRTQLQEYGQVEDTSVFYWFQNRRSRSKEKNHQQNSTTKPTSHQPLVALSSSSTSSDRSTFNGAPGVGFPELFKNSSSDSKNKNYIIPDTQNNQYLNLQANQVQMQAPLPNYHPNQQTGAIATGIFGSNQTPGVIFNEIMGGGGSAGGSSSQMESYSRTLLGEQMMVGHFSNIQIPTSQVRAVGGAGMVSPPRSTATVLINGEEFEVSAVHPFFVQEAFGEGAVLFYQSGHPVPTNNRGVTLSPLMHGASYILKYFPSASAPNQFPLN